MNSKGQYNVVGMMIVAAVTIIVGLVLLQATYPFIGETTITSSVRNDTISAPTAIGGLIYLRGQAVQGNIFVANATGGETVASTNYTITNYVVKDGALTVVYNASGTGTKYVGSTVRLNVTYTYEPFGYAQDGATRSIIPLIAVFGALALVVALLPTVRESIREFMD
jgi:hypothetical protein